MFKFYFSASNLNAMKRIKYLILTILSLSIACKKEIDTAAPTAGFTFSHNTTDQMRLATSDTTTLISTVAGATSLSWDLGDGRKSSDKQLVLSYPKSGTYTVTLTAVASNGKTNSVLKTVTVLDRVLKNIVIGKVYWNTTDPYFAQAGWPLTNTADIYVKIQQLQGNDIYQGGFAPNAPVIYTSPVVTNVSSNTTSPITIAVSPKVVLEKNLLDRKYLISLIARNATGEYVLFSNWYSGSNQIIKADNLAKNTFVINTAFFSSMDLNLDFE
jgi:PKD repeat protein